MSMFEIRGVDPTPLERTDVALDQIHDDMVVLDRSAFGAELNLRYVTPVPAKSASPEAIAEYVQSMGSEKIMSEARKLEAHTLINLQELFLTIKEQVEKRSSTS